MSVSAIHRLRRTLLESFKFLEPKDLLVIALVNHEWQHCSREDEVWAVHLQSPPEDDSVSMLAACREQLRRPNFIAFINGSNLVVADLAKMKSRQLRLGAPFRHTEFGAWVALPKQILYCGGTHNGYVADSYLIDSSSGAVQKLPDMLTRRAGGGIVYYARKVYVFGGDNSQPCPGHSYGDLAECEKFTLDTSQWTSLQSMKCPRRSFTPTLWKDRIFIAGGGGADSEMEVFLLASETYLYANLFDKLPCIDALSTVIVLKDSLVLLAKSTATRVDLRSGKITQQLEVGFKYWYSPGGTATVKGVAYFGVYYESHFYRLNEDLTIEMVNISS